MANHLDILISSILALHNALPINTCFTSTNSCPTTREDWMMRTKEFGKCSSKHQQYACMLTTNDTLGEACINEYDIPPGGVGCPFIQACLKGVGPTINLPQNFKKCPTGSVGCPPEEHDGYTVHELYKYPACLVRNRIFTSSPESNITKSTSGKPNERKGTTVIALSVTFTILSLLAVGLVVYCVVNRKRQQRHNRVTFCCRTVDKAILDGGDNEERCDTSLMSAMVESSNVKSMSDQLDARNIVSAETPEPNEVYLHEAATSGDVQCVRGLLRQGVDVNSKHVDDMTPLHRAANEGHVDVVSVLLDHGADVNAKDNDGWTPLHWAGVGGHVDVVSVLLDHGADVNVQDNDGMIPLHRAAWDGHVDVVSVLLDHGADVSVQEKDGQTPLYRAAVGGHVDVVSVLLDHRADVNAKDKDGQTPLYRAAVGGHVDVVSVLLDHRADVNAKDKDGQIPLIWAAWDGHVDVVSVLLDHGADVNAKDKDGQTPLHWAAKKRHVDVVSVLLDHGAAVNVQDNAGRTPLHWAAERGHVDVVSVLLDHAADINDKDDGGMTPFHRAAGGGHVDVVSVLLYHGADVHAKDNNGENPVQVAVFYPSLRYKLEIPDFLRDTDLIKISDLDQKQRFDETVRKVCSDDGEENNEEEEHFEATDTPTIFFRKMSFCKSKLP